MIRVALPQHLQTLARVPQEVEVDIEGVPTTRAILDALERKYPALRGTIREHGTLKRRAYLRFLVARQTCHSRRRTHRCRRSLPQVASRSLSSERCPAGDSRPAYYLPRRGPDSAVMSGIAFRAVFGPCPRCPHLGTTAMMKVAVK